MEKSNHAHMFVTSLTVVAAGFACLQSCAFEKSRKHSQFNDVLSQLNQLERDGSQNDESGGCMPSDGCLGGLRLDQSYYEQYQLLASHADFLAGELGESSISDAETLEVADSLYTAGRLDKSREYASSVLKNSQDPIMRFRAHLLIAQLHFSRKDLEGGQTSIKEAIAVAESDRYGITDIEKRLLRAQANETCAAMQLALGRTQDGRQCLEAAYYDFYGLPRTGRVEHLQQVLDKLIQAYDAFEAGQDEEKDFDQHQKDVLAPAAAPSA